MSWRMPAVWEAVARHGKLLEWRVLADNKAVCEILAARQPSRNMKATLSQRSPPVAMVAKTSFDEADYPACAPTY